MKGLWKAVFLSCSEELAFGRAGWRTFRDLEMVEKNPWWKNVNGPFPTWEGPIGVKEDGGGCHRATGWVGKMQLHRAVNNRDKEGWPQI